MHAIYGLKLRVTALLPIFIARCYVRAVYAIAQCLSVCLSDRSRCSVKTAKHVAKQRTPHHITEQTEAGLRGLCVREITTTNNT